MTAGHTFYPEVKLGWNVAKRWSDRYFKVFTAFRNSRQVKGETSLLLYNVVVTPRNAKFTGSVVQNRK